MLRVHSQSQWWATDPFTNWSSYPTNVIVQGPGTVLDLSDGSFYQPIVLYPNNNEEVIRFNWDYLAQRVDNYDGLFSEGPFRYGDHIWNDVTNFQVRGDVYNLEFSGRKNLFRLRDYRSLGFGDKINPLSGTGRAVFFPIRYDQTKHLWYHTMISEWNGGHPGGREIIKRCVPCVFYYFNEHTNTIYHGRLPLYFYRTDNNLLCDAYGNLVGADGQYRYMYHSIYASRVIGIDHQTGKPNLFTRSQPGLYDSDGVFSTQFRIFRGMDCRALYKYVEGLCKIDAAYSGPLSPGDKNVIQLQLSAADNWDIPLRQYRESEISASGPNYFTLFPQSDRKRSFLNWNALAAEAYQDLGMSDINGIAGVQDILNSGKDIMGLLSTIKLLPLKRVAAVAQLYLSIHYGLKLMVLDAKTLYDTLERYAQERAGFKRCQAQQFWSVGEGVTTRTYQARYQVYYDEFKFVRDKLHELLMISDLQLTTENWWDGVPMSFVVDWFVNVGDILTAIDNFANLSQRFETICTGRSIKGKRSLVPKDLGCVGFEFNCPVEATYYVRQYQKQLLLPSLVPSVTINPFNHTVEGAALIVSRK